jgi:hypothetical protein
METEASEESILKLGSVATQESHDGPRQGGKRRRSKEVNHRFLERPTVGCMRTVVSLIEDIL